MKRKSMKQFAALMLAAAMALTGCGSATGSKTEGSTSDETAVTTEDKASGEVTGTMEAADDVELAEYPKVVVGCSFSGMQSLAPFRNISGQRNLWYRLLYDRLAMVDDHGVYQPQAAKEWNVAEDGKTWTVVLNDNIVDTAGNKITSDDVVWFIEEYMNNGLKPCFSKVDSVNKIDDYTFEIVMKENMADMFEVILESTFIVSKKAYEESEDGMATKPVTTSPYIVESFTPGSSMTLIKNENYWMTEEQQGDIFQANVKEIEFTSITEASQQQIALETGTVDMISNIDVTVADAFKGNDQFNMVISPSNNNFFMMFSGAEDREIATDLNLRKAICYAVDPQAIIDGALNGYGEPAYDMIPRVSGGFQESWESEEYYPYDVEKAKECLAQSNYKGETLSLLCGTHQQKWATIVQAECQAVGINIELNVLDTALYVSSWYDGRLYDITFIGSGNGGANIWSQMIDGDAYEHGDAMARKDQTLTDMVQFTSKVENYTPENIDKVHRYVTDNAYVYGVYLGYKVAVVNDKVPIVETVIDNEGDLDIAACKFAKTE